MSGSKPQIIQNMLALRKQDKAAKAVGDQLSGLMHLNLTGDPGPYNAAMRRHTGNPNWPDPADGKVRPNAQEIYLQMCQDHFAHKFPHLVPADPDS